MKFNKIPFAIFAIIAIGLSSITKAQTFTQGNLAVFVAAASANNTTGSIVELNTTSANQTAINTYSISGTGANAMRFSGSATSTGYLSTSNDGTLLAFLGANSTNTSSNVNSLNPRAVGTLNSNYTFSIATTYTGTSGNQTRCATSLNNSNWYIADQGGVYTNGSSTASPTGNLRGMKAFGSTVYCGQASSTGTVIQVSTLSAISGGVITGLPGLTNNSSLQDFYLISSGSNGSAFDILYVISATSDAAGTISKYSLVSGNWTSNGNYTTSFGGFGLAAKKMGTGAELYVSEGLGAKTANRLIKLTDVNGFNSSLLITTANNVTLYTTPAGTIMKGVAFAPVTNCVAPAITSLNSNGAICEGATLNLTMTTSGTTPLTYSWTGPNGFTSAFQNPSIVSATAAASGTYTVTVSNGCGTANSSLDVTVNSLPSAIVTPDGNTTFCSGGSVNLSASSGTSYLWSTGATSQAINVTESGNYSVTVTTNNCSTTSAPINITVNPIVTPTINISATPGNIICSGTNVTFSAAVNHGGPTPSFQWKLNGNPVGTNEATYANSGLVNGDLVSCELTSNAGCTSTSIVESDSISITVAGSVSPSISITSDAGSINCEATLISFTAIALNGGTSPIYQWRLNGIPVGANSSTYSSSSLVNGDELSCILTSSVECASPITATSNSISITIQPNLTPAVSISASTGNSICAGTSVQFTASPINGGTPHYQWKKNGNNVGSDDSTYIDAGLLTNDTISCIMTSTELCTSTSVANSNSIVMVVNAIPSPQITGSLSFCTNGSTLLDAGIGFNSYLWSTGETTQSITVTTAGSYSVLVLANNCSGSTSVNITEIPGASQPGAFTTSSNSVMGGQNNVIYTVPGLLGIDYTWNYSGTGVTINGGGNSVTLNFASTATSGVLGVTAANLCGTSSPRTIAITVNPRPEMRITEFMYNGGGAGGAGEFVEFTNVGTSSIDMTGWSFDDNTRQAGSQSLTSFGTVQAGESVILTELNVGTFRSNWNLCTGVKVVGNNANNLGREDEINLYDASGNLIDRITYGDQTYAPGSIRTTLRSGKVSAAGLGINNISQWSLSSAGDAESSFTSVLNEIGSPGKCSHSTVIFDPCFVVNGAPGIIIDVTNTTNYIDGGVNLPPPSPYGLSGVIDDPTDPASTLGIFFSLSDDVTPVNNLTVIVASSNTNVVPALNLILTGSGASRNLKITPAAVGYSNITITVSDGILSSSFVINYAASDPAPTIDNHNTAWHTGISDASNAIALDTNYFITGDDELDVLNVYSRNHSGLPFVSYNYASTLNLPDPSKPEVDIEAATRSTSMSNKIYWTGSMSNGKLPYDNKPNRDRLFATTVTGTGATTSFAVSGYVNIRTALLAWGDANGYDFTASAAAGVNSKALAGFSLEGMVFGPDGTTLFLGLRAPLVPTSLRHNAVIAPILNFEAWFNNGSPTSAPVFGSPIELNLDFRGIRDIIRLSNGTYIIVAGSPVDDGGVNNLYKWTGYASDAPVAIDNIAGGILNIEGLMEVTQQNGQASLTELQLITDGGAQILYQDNSEAKDFSDLNLRKFRSDVLTGLDLDICSGFAATIIPSGNTSICAGTTVTLTAPAGSNISYAWSNGETSQSISASAHLSFTVTVSSSTSGCTATSLPLSVTSALASDFNGDNVTNNIDFLQMLGVFNQTCSGCAEDMNQDGVINNLDFLILLGQFNHTCEQ